MNLGAILEKISHPTVLVVFKTDTWYNEHFNSIYKFFGSKIESAVHNPSAGYIQITNGPRFEFREESSIGGMKVNYAITEGRIEDEPILYKYCLEPPHFYSLDEASPPLSDIDDI